MYPWIDNTVQTVQGRGLSELSPLNLSLADESHTTEQNYRPRGQQKAVVLKIRRVGERKGWFGRAPGNKGYITVQTSWGERRPSEHKREDVCERATCQKFAGRPQDGAPQAGRQHGRSHLLDRR